MPITTSDGQTYETQSHYFLDLPTETGDSEDKSGKNLSQAPKQGAREPLRVTVTPHMQAGESEQGSPEGGLDKPYDFVLARHGDTEENESNTVRKKESPLNEDGIAEAHKIAKKLQDEGVTAIHASSLIRSKETAGIIHADTGIPVTFDPRLNALDVGKYEGQPCDTANPEIKDYIKNKQDEKIPGGESFNDFTNRTFSGIRDAVLNNKDGKVGIITHNSVHALYEGWEKTGQDNPDIDHNEAVKEETKPGTVVPKTMQPDSAILQPTFDERFSGIPSGSPQKVPGESFEGTPSLYHPNLRNAPAWPNDLKKMPYSFVDSPIYKNIPDYLAHKPLSDVQQAPPARYTPMSDYKPFSPSQEKSIEELAAKHGIEKNKILNFLKELKPEDIIGTGELGMTKRFIPNVPKARKDIAKSYKDIFDALVKKPEVQSPTVQKPVIEGHENIRVPEDPNALPKLSPYNKEGKNYDPELSKWLKNQFEGGPIEGEKYSKTPEDFNTANRGVAQLQRPANENPKAEPWETDFDKELNWTLRSQGKEPGKQINPTPYEERVMMEKLKKVLDNKAKGFAPADRNKFPLTYDIPNDRLYGHLSEHEYTLSHRSTATSEAITNAMKTKAEIEERLEGLGWPLKLK